MKTRRFTTMLMSAYLSAMLASSVASQRPNAALASTVDPAAARAAFREAVSGIGASGWAPSATAMPGAPAAESQVIAIRVAPPADPVMNDDLMGRLLKLIAEQKEPSTIPANICVLFSLCDGSAPLKLRMVETENPSGDYMAMPMKDDAKDVVVIRKMADGTIQFYLTDKTRKLRAAAISEKGAGRLVLNETVAKNYESTLSHLAKEAQDLPPLGTAVAGNS